MYFISLLLFFFAASSLPLVLPKYRTKQMQNQQAVEDSIGTN